MNNNFVSPSNIDFASLLNSAALAGLGVNIPGSFLDNSYDPSLLSLGWSPLTNNSMFGIPDFGPPAPTFRQEIKLEQKEPKRPKKATPATSMPRSLSSVSPLPNTVAPSQIQAPLNMSQSVEQLQSLMSSPTSTPAKQMTLSDTPNRFMISEQPQSTQRKSYPHENRYDSVVMLKNILLMFLSMFFH
jgi:hypothetical protein